MSHILYLVPLKQRTIVRDAATVTGREALFGTDDGAHFSAATVQGQAVALATALYIAVPEGTNIFGIALPFAAEVRTYALESTVVSSIASSVTADLYNGVDANTVTSVAAITSGETYKGAAIDAATVTTVAVPTAPDTLQAVPEAPTITAVVAISAVEVITFVSEVTTLTSVAAFVTLEVTSYVDPQPGGQTNVTSVASMVTLDTAAWAPDSATVTSSAVMVTTDSNTYAPDSATTTSVAAEWAALATSTRLQTTSTQITYASDNAQFSDISTITSTAASATTDIISGLDAGTQASAASPLIGVGHIDHFQSVVATGQIAVGTTTPVFPFTKSTAIGDCVIFTANVANTGVTISGISDTKGNTWTQDKVSTTAGNSLWLLRSQTDVAGMVGGSDSLTFTMSTLATPRYITTNYGNIMPASPLDTTLLRVMTSATPSIGPSSSFAQANELAIMVSSIADTTPSDPTFPANADGSTGGVWNQVAIAQNSGANKFIVYWDEYITTSGPTQGSYTGTSGVAGNNIILVTYKLK